MASLKNLEWVTFDQFCDLHNLSAHRVAELLAANRLEWKLMGSATVINNASYSP